MGKWGTAFDIVRDVMHAFDMYMDVHEQAVLFFIYRRTRMYGKEWEAIPLRHFKHGIIAGDNTKVIGPVDMGEPKLLEAIKNLEGKGLIEIRRHPTDASSFRIREDDEINQPNVMAYIQRHQKSLHTRLLKRLGRNFSIQRILSQSARSPQSLGTVTHNNGEAVGQNYGELVNIPKENRPILNPADEGPRYVSVPVSTRKIKLPTRK